MTGVGASTDWAKMVANGGGKALPMALNAAVFVTVAPSRQSGGNPCSANPSATVIRRCFTDHCVTSWPAVIVGAVVTLVATSGSRPPPIVGVDPSQFLPR